MALPVVPLAAAAFGAAFLAGRVLQPDASQSSPAAAAPPDGSGAQLTDPFGYALDTATIGDLSGQPAGTLQGLDQGSGAASGGLPGGGTSTPPPAPAPAAPAPTAAPHYLAQVTRATALWNDGTHKWVYNGPNAVKVGTQLTIRAAKYLKGGVTCYPIVAGTPYGGYWVPVANVRLLQRLP